MILQKYVIALLNVYIILLPTNFYYSLKLVETNVTKSPTLQVLMSAVGLLIVLLMMVYSLASAQQSPTLQNPTQTPILATYIQKDNSSSSNSSRYNLQDPVNIDLTRFAGGQIYSLTSNDQAGVFINEESGTLLMEGNVYNEIRNQSHITTEILDLYGYTTFDRMDQDIRTNITTYNLKPGSFSLGHR
jgi:hypothetical protein